MLTMFKKMMGTDKDPKRLKGTIVRTFPIQGYAWIKDLQGQSYFAHISQMEKGVLIEDLRIDQECTFIPAENHKGPVATHIQFWNM